MCRLVRSDDMKLKNFLKICDYSNCIFGIYAWIKDKEELIEEIENIKDKSELEEYLDGIVTSVQPYNEDTISICVIVKQLSIGKQLELAGYDVDKIFS
jgi:hypothetical protein